MSHEYLPPQADRITTVATVVDAIAAGCDTATSIAEGLGMATRQGSYYPHAAAALGYVAQDVETHPITWHLTPAGAAFAAMAADVRARDLVEKLAGCRELDTLTSPGGLAALEAEISGSGYSAETTRRRVQTMQSWAAFLALDHTEQTSRLAGSMRETAEFAPAAAAALAQARRAQATASTQSFGDVCGSCFMTKSISGVCDNCD